MKYLLVIVSVMTVMLTGCPSKDQESKESKDLVAVSDTAPSASITEVAEVEPNEKTDQAMEINKSSAIKAQLESAAGPKKIARDWYKIKVSGKKSVRLKLSAIAEDNLALKILDGDKNELFRVDSQGVGEGEEYPNLVISDSVFVRVSGASGGKGGDYRFEVIMSEVSAGQEVEHNGRYSLANPLSIGQQIKGYLGSMKDEDWYLLAIKDLPTGSVLRLDLTGVERVRHTLEVLEYESRTPIIKVNSPKAEEGVLIRNLGIPAGAESVYVVIKSAWVPGPKPKKFVRTYNFEKLYTLSVSSEAGGDNLEKEPNDSAEDAIGLLDGQKINGYLSVANDVDWYKIEVERPSILSAELSGLDRVDLQLYVVNPEKKDQNKNFELCRVNSAKVNEEEILTNCALNPGTNYVRVEGAWKKVDDKWVRDFTNLDETYSLTLNLRTDEGKEERESNNNPEKATIIKIGDTVRGTLHPVRDVDYYKLDLSDQDGPRNTVIDCTGIPKLDISISLMGPELDEKGKPKRIAVSSKGKQEAAEQIQKELMPGEYHIVVRGTPTDTSNTRDQYVLTLSQP
jgi:hypothetical protein